MHSSTPAAAREAPASAGTASRSLTTAELPAIYTALAAPFEVTHHDTRGGVELTYITGEQCTTRLNTVLGFWRWSFAVLADGINVEADEAWCRGRLTVRLDDGTEVVREQYGSQKIKRSRTTGAPLDIGFDLKGAATDALKKCASLIGVGLYLSVKEERAAPGRRASAPAAQPASAPFVCEECGRGLGQVRFKDGTVWQAGDLAGYGRRKFGRVLCLEHCRAATEARKAAIPDRSS